MPVIVQETTNAATTSYVYGLDMLSATDNSSVTTYFLQDGLGSTTGLADDGGAVTDTYAYDVFGAMKSQTGTSANAWRFTGELNDSTVARSPYYLRARYHDPALGPFLSRDPFKGFAVSPQSRNAYTYSVDDPANLVDPYGFCGIRSFGDALDCGKKVGKGVIEVDKTVLDWTLQSAAVPPYAEYYFSYQVARLMNRAGAEFGVPGYVLSHLLALPLAELELEGLTTDIVIDYIEGHTVKQETVRDEGKEGHIIPRFLRRFVPAFGPMPQGGPSFYLPGLHKYDQGLDFEW